MRKLAGTILMLVAMYCLTMSFSGTASAKTAEATGKYLYDYAFEELTYLNNTRTSAGKSKVKMDQYLTDIAMTRARELATKYSHTRPDGTSCFTAGNSKWYKAENIAYGYSTAKKVNKAWTNSKDHYKTRTTGSYTGVGIGCFRASDGTIYWTEEFGVYRSTAKQKSNSSVGSAKNVKVTLSSAENTSSGIKLTWKRAYGVSGYYVYRKTSGGSYKKIKTISKASTKTYTDKSAKNGTKYTYKVVPYTKKDGKKGTGTTKSAMCVVQPTSLKAKSLGYGDVKLTWKKASGASGYRIEYGTDKSFGSTYTYDTVKGAGTTSYEIKNLKAGKTYYFRICSYKTKSGKKYYSAKTSKVSLKIPSQTIGTPKITGAKSERSEHATVTWNKVSGVTGYKVYYSTDKNFSGTLYFYRVKDGSTTSYELPNLKSGKTYYFKVKAYVEDSNGSHDSPESSVVSRKIK